MPSDSDSSTNPITLLRGKQSTELAEHEEIPPGQLRMVITYLEMFKLPKFPHQSQRAENISIIRSQKPTVGFYRFLYQSVGEEWLWYERNQMSDAQLESIIQHKKVQVFVLYVNGTPAGFSELDSRQKDEIELAYFGLIPEFIGRGLGSYFLRWTIEKAWVEEPKRLWVHSCNFDSPHAIAIYQKAGFTPYKREAILIDDPRLH